VIFIGSNKKDAGVAAGNNARTPLGRAGYLGFSLKLINNVSV